MDRLRIGTFTANGRFSPLLDLNDGTVNSLVRDTLSFNAPERNQKWAQGTNRYQGARLAAEALGNATVEAEWYISGATSDAALANMETFFAQVESVRPGRYVEWRPEGASRSTYFEIRGPAPWDFMYRWIEFSQTHTLHIKAGWSIAPLGEGERTEIVDDFSVDALTDYTFDSGTGGVSVDTTNKKLNPVALGAGSYLSAVTADAPALYWRLGDAVGSGTVADASGNGRTGTVGAGVTLGATGALTGDSDKAASFNDSATAIITSAYNPFAVGSSRTFEAWVNRTDTTGYDVFFAGSAANGPNIHGPSGTTDVQFFPDHSTFPSNGVTWTAALPTGSYAHVVVTYNDATKVAELFVNGVSKGTQTAGVGFNATPGNFMVGRSDASFFKGSLDEVAVYTSILSAARISAHYTAGITAGSYGTEIRARYTARGYTYLDHQNSVQAAAGTTVSGFKAGALVDGVDNNNYVEVYVTDNGTNSILKIDVVVAGVRTNRASVNLAARVTTGSDFVVRGRREGNVIYAEHFSTPANATPIAAPTTSTSYTLAAGEQAALAAGGYGGWTFIPQSSNAYIKKLYVEPFVYRGSSTLTFPRVLDLNGTIQGDAPATVDLSVTSGPMGGTTIKHMGFALSQLDRTQTGSVGQSPLGLYPASGGSITASGWSTVTDPNYTGGSGVSSPSGVTQSVDLKIVPGQLAADDFTDGFVSLEVYARAGRFQTSDTRWLLQAFPSDYTLPSAPTQYTAEYGSTGETGVVGTGDGGLRIYRLGTLVLPAENRDWTIRLNFKYGTASTNTLDWIVVVPSKSRTALPTGILSAQSATLFDGNPGTFLRVATDLSFSRQMVGNLSGIGPYAASVAGSFSGSMVEVAPGSSVRFLAFFTDKVPDDPATGNGNDLLSMSAAIKLAYQPRYFLPRGT